MPDRPRALWFPVCTIILLAAGQCLAQPTGYSTLDRIGVGSVVRMALRLALPIGQRDGYAGGPVANGDRLFVITPFPHSVLAVDLTHPDGPPLWRYTPHANPIAAGPTSTDVTTGGIVVASDRLFLNTFDGHTIALDAATGSVVWDVKMTEVQRGETLLVAPLVADNRVFVGNSGSDFGVRGWMAALDASSGQVLWKRFNTGPDAEVGIGSGFAARYLPRDHDLGVRSWPPDAWQQGGGDLADTPVYDAAGVLTYATGNPAPSDAARRPGANYFTSGLLARDAATGAARWFVPINPHDLYGLGAGGSLIAADVPWRGGDRSVLIHPDANGMVYVLDASSGELLSATRFAEVNATDGVDISNAALRRNPTKASQVNATTRDICPAWPGATGGSAQAAYSPGTGLLYIPVRRLCMDMEVRQATYMPGTPYTGVNRRIKALRGAGGRGALLAWDVAGGKPAWTVEESLPVESGVLATAGDVVFYGTLDGWFKALDARSGKLLWQFHAASGIVGQPVTFQRGDGQQFVAVVAGVGGAAGAVAQQDIDIRDATAAGGYANGIRDLQPAAGGMLYVFALQ